MAGELDGEDVNFLDTSAPVCDVADALGPGVVPDCDAEDVAFCASLGCPVFDIIDEGPVSGDLNGDIGVCIRLQSPPDPNLFIPVSGCLQIATDEATWAGPFTASFNLVYGAFGDYFVSDGAGSTIRLNFTQLQIDPPLFINRGTLTSLGDGDDDDDDD